MTADNAREKAEKMIGQIAEGKDPAQEIIDFKGEPTFQKLIELYRERHLPKKKSAKNDEIQINAYLEDWKTRKLSDIRRKDAVALHLKVGEDHGHYSANRLIALLRKMFNLAQIWGIYQGDENPATGIEMFSEKKRERFVRPDELPRLMAALKTEENFYIRSAFLLCLLTGARKGEVLSMKWEDIDLARGVWRIPETKAGHSHLVPLPTPVRELLQKLPIIADNPYVFPGRRGKHLVNINKSWNEIRAKAKLEDVRIHDLRRTVGSWLAGAGASLLLIGKVLNHSQPSTTAVYARLDVEPVRAALEANAQRMLMIAEGEKKQ
jgi:integrase